MTPTPWPTPVFVNVVTSDNLPIILLLSCIVMLLAIGLALYLLVNTLLSRRPAGKKAK